MRAITFLLILLTSMFCFMSCGKKTETEMQAQEKQAMEEELAANIAIDPVCDMKVNKEEAQFTAEYQGETYYFCMEEHKVAFLENPDNYLSNE